MDNLCEAQVQNTKKSLDQGAWEEVYGLLSITLSGNRKNMGWVR